MFLRLFSFLSLLATFCVLYQSSHISAQEVSDYKSSLDVSAVHVGEQVVLKLSFTTSKEVNSELDLSSNSWGELEIIEVLSIQAEPDGSGLIRNQIRVLVAVFSLQSIESIPAVRLVEIDNEHVEKIIFFPPVQLDVISLFSNEQFLDLSGPSSLLDIDGERTPFFIPLLIGLGVVVLFGTFFFIQFVHARNLKDVSSVESTPTSPIPVLDQSLMEGDVTEAYRLIAFRIRAYLEENFDIPASSMTTEELEGELHATGVSGEISRLSRELLRECDSVVYAGYRPAQGRRVADFELAKTVLESRMRRES